MKVSSLVVLSLLLLSAVGSTNVNVMPVSAQTKLEDYWKLTLWGSESTARTLIDSEYESDSDVDTLLKWGNGNTAIYLENNDSYIKNQVIDLSESTFGKISTDWIGVANDADYPAAAGVGYWLPNGSSSPNAADSSAAVTEGVSSPSPASGGYYYQVSMVFAADTNTDIDYTYIYNKIDGDVDGVDNEITADSYIYLQTALKVSQDNGSDTISDVCVYIVLSDGSTNYVVGVTICNATGASPLGASWSTAADNTWIDCDSISLTAGRTPLAATGGRMYCEEAAITDSTWYESGLLFNIQDLINDDPESADRITATEVVGWGVAGRIKYSEGAATLYGKVRNILIGDLDDFCMYEATETTDSATKRSDNFINGTSMTVSSSSIDDSDYLLTSGYSFYCGHRIQRLQFTSYDLCFERSSYSYTTKNSDTLKVVREDTFDTDISSDEPIAEPSTMYINVTSLDNDEHFLYAPGFSISGNEMFASDKELDSDWSITDEDGSPTINDLDDIEREYSSIDVPLQITPDSALSLTSDELNVKVYYYATLSELDTISPIGFLQALSRKTFNIPFIGSVKWTTLILIGLVILVVIALAVLLAMKAGGKRFKKKR